MNYIRATRVLSILAVAVLLNWLLHSSKLHAFPQETAGTKTTTSLDKQFEESVIPFLEMYCLDCHAEGGEGDVDLSVFHSVDDVKGNLELWSNAMDALRQSEMPPDDSDQPSKAVSKRIQSWILHTIADSKEHYPALTHIRRMNRFEYENTMRDLFKMKRDCFNNSSRIIQTTTYFDPATKKMPGHVLAVSYFMNNERRFSDLSGVSTLPVDPPVEYGYSNDQEALNLPPILMENYFEIASALLESGELNKISPLAAEMFANRPHESKSESAERAHKELSAFLPRAFRRDVTDTELLRYTKLFDSEFSTSEDYALALKSTVAAILVSPNFLYHFEYGEASNPDASNDQQDASHQFALASRLSYFLWGSMPDDKLLNAARDGKLADAKEISRQVERMMADPKVKSLSVDFGMQWLKLQKAASAQPDKNKYPDYYIKRLPPPAVSMMIEQMLFFETILVENRSILEFIKSDFAYLNKQLINWYQLDINQVLGFQPPDDTYEDFFRIKWPSEHRGGVISSGAMLVATSTTTRTSPVFRGAWILDVIFNSPPPPAPADVPPLEPANLKDIGKLNVRDRLKQHRLDPACSTCHRRLDPLGFGLEIFDTVGRWRKTYENGDPIDAKGDIDGDVYDGPVRMKNVILRNKERFVQAFVEHTLKYALGRQLHYSDEPEIKKITEKVLADDCRFHSVIREIALSDLFRD